MNTLVQPQKKARFSTKELVTISLLAALAYVLMLFHLPFKFLGFLEIEFSDVPAVFAALQFGPFAGLFVELVKNLIKAITATTTGGVGELANFIISSAYVVPVGILYQLKKKADRKIKAVKELENPKKSNNYLFMIMLFSIGTISFTAMGAFINYFVTVPLYATLFGGMSVVVGSAAASVPAIKNLGTLILLGITPFNIAKGIGMSILGYYTFRLINKKNLNY